MARAQTDINAALESGAHGEVLLRIKAVPGSSRTRIAGMLGDRLKVQLAAPPEGGKANKALRDMLAKKLGIPASHITLTAGQARPEKTVTITELSPTEVAQKLKRT